MLVTIILIFVFIIILSTIISSILASVIMAGFLKIHKETDDIEITEQWDLDVLK